MKWLGHHEFGLTHKPFEFVDGEVVNTLGYSLVSINYWLSLWNSTYRHLLSSAPAGSIFFCYEELCRDPNSTLGRLYEMTKTLSKVDVDNLKIMPLQEKQILAMEEALSSESQQIYDELKVRGPLF